MIFLLLSALIIPFSQSKNSAKHFGADEFEEFRDLVIYEIQAEETGLTPDHPLVSFYDGMGDGNNPLIPSLVRLIFHDCSGLNDDEDANDLNEYICNGCIKSDVVDHFGLYEGGIDPIEPICAIYAESSGLSRADCWALAATIAIELSVTNHNGLLDAFGIETTIGINPGDIPYLIGRKDCDGSPDGDADVIFHPFSAFDGWDAVSVDLKTRFHLDNNREVVALLGGGHSIGRGHAKISGFASGWDLSPEILDNDFFTTLINREPVANIVGLNIDLYQNTMDLVPYPNETTPTSDKQFLIDIPEWLRPMIVPVTSSPRLLKYLNVDVALAFDLRKWVDNGLHEQITCHTDAYRSCAMMGFPPFMVLIDGYEVEIPNVAYCPYKQCPLQCPDNKGGYERFNQILFGQTLLEEDVDSDCVRVFVEQFSNNNTLFQHVFVDAFTKMIKTGYYKGNGGTKLIEINLSSQEAINSVSYIGGTTASLFIIVTIGTIMLITIIVMAIYIAVIKKQYQKHVSNIANVGVEISDQVQSQITAMTDCNSEDAL